jgi:hypothetical protein
LSESFGYGDKTTSFLCWKRGATNFEAIDQLLIKAVFFWRMFGFAKFNRFAMLLKLPSLKLANVLST